MIAIKNGNLYYKIQNLIMIERDSNVCDGEPNYVHYEFYHTYVSLFYNTTFQLIRLRLDFTFRLNEKSLSNFSGGTWAILWVAQAYKQTKIQKHEKMMLNEI